MSFRLLSSYPRTLLLAVLLSFVSTAQAFDATWNFDGNLAANYGVGTMSYLGDTSSFTSFGTTSSYGLPSLYGDDGTAQVMSFPGAEPSQGYTVHYNASTNIEEYTIIWDILYPESSDNSYRALLQTNTGNANDTDFCINNSPAGGIGISGLYTGAIVPDTWNRIAITRSADGTMSKYINGGYVGEQDTSLDRWDLDSQLYHILTDENYETEPGYLASHRFVDHAMTQAEIMSLGGVNAGGTAVSGKVLPDPSIAEPGSFTIAVLGDTQCYSMDAQYALSFNAMTQWLVDNKETLNIQFVTHVGDIVNVDTTEQWDRATIAMANLDGEIPYAVVPGNHDYLNNNDRVTLEFNNANRFGPGSDYDLQSTLKGYYPGESESRINTYHTFSAGGQELLMISLEFGPRDEVVNWAQTVVDAHPNHRVIITTHAYNADGGALFDHSVDPNDPEGRTYDEMRTEFMGNNEAVAGNPHTYIPNGDCNDARELWDKFVKKNENSAMVISGHQFDELDGYPYVLTEAENGNDVYQMLFNTQTRANGGDGWIRLLEFSADGKTVTAKTYSPTLDQWSYASDEFFTFELSPVQKIAGDANGDGTVDGSDVTILAGNWQVLSGATWSMGDFNGDGAVDGSDVTILAGNWQYGVTATAASVPEPSSFVLLLSVFAGVFLAWPSNLKSARQS